MESEYTLPCCQDSHLSISRARWNQSTISHLISRTNTWFLFRFPD